MKGSVCIQLSFLLSSYLGFTQSYQYSCMVILLISRIERPKYTTLFIFTHVLFISIFSKFSGTHFVPWQLSSNTRQLIFFVSCHNFDATLLPYILLVFLNTKLGISLEKLLSKLFCILFSVPCPELCMALTSFLIELDYLYFLTSIHSLGHVLGLLCL